MTSIPYDEKLLSKLAGKVVLITGSPFVDGIDVLGGARGIGAATVGLFHSYGAIVEFADLNDDLGRNLQIKLGEYIPLSTLIEKQNILIAMLPHGRHCRRFLKTFLNDVDESMLLLLMPVSSNAGNSSMIY
jgi:hypothetical protein